MATLVSGQDVSVHRNRGGGHQCGDEEEWEQTAQHRIGSVRNELVWGEIIRLPGLGSRSLGGLLKILSGDGLEAVPHFLSSSDG